jgi:KUP system potassium uptake protein
MKSGNIRARNMLGIKELYLSFDCFALNDITRLTLEYAERHPWARAFLSVLAIFGVCLIIADGILTPAQSVLGAIQGLEVIRPDLGLSAIVGITCGILVFIYALQPLGIGRISSIFAPIVIVWLLMNFSFGVYVSNLAGLTSGHAHNDYRT